MVRPLELTLYGHIKTALGLYSNTVIGTLAVDGCMDCYICYREEGPAGRAGPHLVPCSLYQM